MSNETPTVEDIKDMSAEEVRALKNKAAKRLLTRVILPKIGISIAIAVVSHVIANVLNDKIDDFLADKNDDDEDEDNED